MSREYYWQSKCSIKLPSAVKTASILDQKLVVFAWVSLARDPITSFIFWIRSFDLLRNFAMTYNSKTPHTKESKGLQSGELGGQTSSSHSPVRFSWASPASSCCLGQRCHPAWRCNDDFQLSKSILRPYIFSYLSCSSRIIFQTFFNIVNSALFVFP